MSTLRAAGSWNRMVRESLAAGGFLASLAVVAMRLPLLPARIHTPINGGGDASGMASRNQVWLLIVIGGWLYALLSLLNLMPADGVTLSRPLSAERGASLMSSCKAAAGWLKAGLMAGLLVWVCWIVY